MQIISRRAVLTVLLLAFIAVPLMAQGGFINASEFAYGYPGGPNPLRLTVGNSTTGSHTVTVDYGYVSLPGGVTLKPLSTVAPVTVGVGANADTVTPSAVSCTTPSRYSSCTFTATFSHIHGRGDQVISGTIGLQEAVSFVGIPVAPPATNGASVILHPKWKQLGGTKAKIEAVVSTTPSIWILDLSGTSPVWYGKSGTGAAAYSAVNNDMTFQLTLSGGTATKTLSQTYAVAPSCVGTYLSGTATGVLKVTPTTSNVAVADSVSETPVVQVNCILQK